MAILALTHSNNRLLAALPRKEYQRLLPHLETVELARGRILYEAGDPIQHVYFVTHGVISLLSITGDAQTIEVGMVGNEGMVGAPLILRCGTTPCRAVVQISAHALMVKAEALSEEFNRCGQLQDVLLRYMHALHTEVAQSAICNRFHSVRQRFCRWLLLTSDRVQKDELELTQDLIACVLGTHRNHVGVAARALQRVGLIRYRPGRITILSRPGVESASCECYRSIREWVDHFLGL